jgi:hypothetical protein
MLRVVVIRQDTHTGSYWLATELERALNLSVFFQFAGKCGNATLGSSRAAIVSRALATGCGCFETVSRVQTFCSHGCGAADSVQCRGVAIVLSDFNLAKELQQQHGTDLVTWERDNVAKRAVSALKDACKTPALLNHAHLRDVRSATRTLLYVDPNLYTAAVREGAAARERFAKAFPDGGSKLGNGALIRLHYEDMQSRPVAETSRLMDALSRRQGVAQSRALQDGDAASDLARMSSPSSSWRAPFAKSVVKTASEDLAHMLLNFDAINASQDRWPCLQRQLLSPRPERFAACRAPFPRAHVSLATSRSVIVDCSARVCRMPGKNQRLSSSTSTFAACFDEARLGHQLCKLAGERVRALDRTVAGQNRSSPELSTNMRTGPGFQQPQLAVPAIRRPAINVCVRVPAAVTPSSQQQQSPSGTTSTRPSSRVVSWWLKHAPLENMQMQESSRMVDGEVI